MFFLVFFGQNADYWGDSYPEIVDSAIEFEGGVSNKLIAEIDKFLTDYPTNITAAQALDKITDGFVGETASFPPTLLDFLAWLSAYLKQKRAE